MSPLVAPPGSPIPFSACGPQPLVGVQPTARRLQYEAGMLDAMAPASLARVRRTADGMLGRWPVHRSRASAVPRTVPSSASAARYPRVRSGGCAACSAADGLEPGQRDADRPRSLGTHVLHALSDRRRLPRPRLEGPLRQTRAAPLARRGRAPRGRGARAAGGSRGGSRNRGGRCARSRSPTRGDRERSRWPIAFNL